jgi:DNA-binding transcriptional regulator YiaG
MGLAYRSNGPQRRIKEIEFITPLGIKNLLHKLQISYQEFAKDIGYAEPTVYGWMVEANVISRKAQLKIQEYMEKKGMADGVTR